MISIQTKHEHKIWLLLTLFITCLIAWPIFNICSAWIGSKKNIFDFYDFTQLQTLGIDTVLLIISVLIPTIIIGTGLAWLTSNLSFPGKKIISWVLVLPMTIPTYVLGFIYIGIFDYSGEFQTFLREKQLMTQAIPFRSLFGLSFVMTLSMYPYVYLIAKQAFKTQSLNIQESAKLTGASRWQIFKDFTLPLTTPWILSAALLVTMECLADFGTVYIFSYNTLTTAIYKSWYGFFALDVAGQISSLLTLFSLAFVYFKYKIDHSIKSDQDQPHHQHCCESLHDRTKLSSCIAFLICFIVIAFGLLIPISTLVSWAMNSFTNVIFSDLLQLTKNTFYIAIMATLAMLTLSFLASMAQRFSSSKLIRLLNQVSCLGYSLPGSIFAVSVFISIYKSAEYINKIQPTWQITALTLTIIPLVVGLSSRFFAVSFQTWQSGLRRIAKSQEEAATLLGANSISIITHIKIPQLRLALLTGFILTFLEVIKEMPMTVMTRPFGFDTLSVRIFELTSEGDWFGSAPAALLILLLGSLPMVFLRKKLV